MGTAPSITHIRREGKVIQIKGGPTDSQVRKAKYLKKDVKDLSTKEMQTPIEEYIRRDRKKGK